MDGVSERLNTALGALVAAALVVGAFVLLVHVLDSGGGGAPPATIVRVQVPAGTTSTGKSAQPGHAALGTKAPQGEAAPAASSARRR